MTILNDFKELVTLAIRNRLAAERMEARRITEISDLDTAQLSVGDVIAVAEVREAVDTLMSQRFDATVERTTQDDEPTIDLSDPQKIREFFAKKMMSPDTEIQTVNGPVRYRDVPKDESGDVPDEWLDENCTCDDHEGKRIARDTATGMYL